MKSIAVLILASLSAFCIPRANALASKPVEPRAYVQSGPDGVFYARCIPAKGDAKPSTAIYQVLGETDKLFDRYDWFAPGGVVLGWSPIKGEVAVMAAM